MVRLVRSLVLVGASAPMLCLAEIPSLNTAVRAAPKVFVSVQFSKGSGDIVQIVAPEGTYGKALMEKNAATLAKDLRSEPREFNYITDANGEKAFFVVDGLIPESGDGVYLQPIARNFMIGQSSTVIGALGVTAYGVRPSPYSTLANYTSPGADLVSEYDPAGPSITYKIAIKTSNPSAVQIPARYLPQETVVNAGDSAPRRSWLVALLVVASGASAGALVYFALRSNRG